MKNKNVNTEDIPNLVPLADISRNENGIDIKLDVPGVHRENIDLSVENDILTVTAESGQVANSDEFTFREFETGRYIRKFNLDKTINSDDIKARLENGVLEINLTYREPQITKINIS